jgi:hypothetical protein
MWQYYLINLTCNRREKLWLAILRNTCYFEWMLRLHLCEFSWLGSDPRMIALARASSSCKRQTCPLIRERAPHQQTRNRLTVIKIWSWAPDGCLTPRQTGRLIVGRNITLTQLSQLRVITVVRIEKLIAEIGTFQKSRGRGTSTVGSHYQATASEDCEARMCAVVTVIFGLCNSVRLS